MYYVLARCCRASGVICNALDRLDDTAQSVERMNIYATLDSNYLVRLCTSTSYHVSYDSTIIFFNISTTTTTTTTAAVVHAFLAWCLSRTTGGFRRL